MTLALPLTLTPSKISSFTSCPLSFRFSVIEHLPEVPSIQAVQGTAVHRALELLFSETAAGGRDAAAAQVCMEKALLELEGSDELAELGLDEEGRGAFGRRCSELLARYFDLEDPNEVDAVGLELDLRAEVDGLVLRGIIDRLDRSPGGGLAVVDYKTGRAPRPEQARSRLSSLQLYAYLCEKALGERPRTVRLMYLRDRVVVSADTSDQSLRGVSQRARAVWTAIERACEEGDFRPHPSVLCKWCSFTAYCPVYGGDPELAAAGLGCGGAAAAGLGCAESPAAAAGLGGVESPAAAAGARLAGVGGTLPA